MRLGLRAETPLEQLALWLGVVPEPLFETHVAACLARTISTGVEIGIFDCLERGPLSAAQIANACGTEARATILLLDALVGSRYLRWTAERYALAPLGRKWLGASSPASIRDKILLQTLEWDWLRELEGFVRAGQPLDFHATMSGPQRGLYHRSMRALAGLAAREVAWRAPAPVARRLLDLGGSHGHFAASICRRHAGLSAEILELPDAIEYAAPIMAREGLSDRLLYRPGDVRTADLGRHRYDMVFMSNLAHHLTAAQNKDLARRVAVALRPGGTFVVVEPVVGRRRGSNSQLTALLSLYFALQSSPGAQSWTRDDIRSWQEDAGLRPRRTLQLWTAPGWILQAALRP